MVLLVFTEFGVEGLTLVFGALCLGFCVCPTLESRVSASLGFMVYRVWAGRLRAHFIFPILLWTAQYALVKNITPSFSC